MTEVLQRFGFPRVLAILLEHVWTQIRGYVISDRGIDEKAYGAGELIIKPYSYEQLESETRTSPQRLYSAGTHDALPDAPRK